MERRISKTVSFFLLNKCVWRSWHKNNPIYHIILGNKNYNYKMLRGTLSIFVISSWWKLGDTFDDSTQSNLEVLWVLLSIEVERAEFEENWKKITKWEGCYLKSWSIYVFIFMRTYLLHNVQAIHWFLNNTRILEPLTSDVHKYQAKL
jgi:hypothetical protein